MFKRYYMYSLGTEKFFVEAEDLHEAEGILKLEGKWTSALEYLGSFSDVYAKSSGLKVY